MEQLSLSGLEASIAECAELFEQRFGMKEDLQEQQHLRAKAIERAEQIATGRCDFKPLPMVFTEPFRAELTVERHSVFVSDDYQGKSWERKLEVKHPVSGQLMTCLVRIGRVGKDSHEHGVLTQAHQEVYYRLLQIWGEQGYPLASFKKNDVVVAGIQLSAYELVKRVLQDDSARSYERVRKLVHDMAAIPIVLENYIDWRGSPGIDQFTLLAGVDWQQRSSDVPLSAENSKVTILFSTRITEGFLAKYSKILLGNTVFGLESDGKRQSKGPYYIPVAALLDSQLATKDEYSIRLDGLAQMLGAIRYRYKSQRKQKIEHTVKLLNGRPMRRDNDDWVMRVTLRESDDGSDYVLVAKRVRAKAGRDDQTPSRRTR